MGTGHDGTLPRVIGPDHDRGIEIAHPDGTGVSGRAGLGYLPDTFTPGH
jgi:hypothetical protein